LNFLTLKLFIAAGNQFEMPEEETVTAWCPGKSRSIWIRPSSRVITLPNPTKRWCPEGDHHPTSSTTTMLQMVCDSVIY
jgi:hypothetical protein